MFCFGQRFPDNIKDYWEVVTNFFASPDMDIESEENNSSDSSNQSDDLNESIEDILTQYS